MNEQLQSDLMRQEWWEVLKPPQGISEQCRQLVSRQRPSGELSTESLSSLLQEIANDPSIWQPLVVVDPSRRRYRLLYEDERIDVWVLSWMPGQGTGYHDHDHSGVALRCVQGSILEKQLRVSGVASRIEMKPGTERTGGPGYIHAVSHLAGEPAVSLHAYSPPLKLVGQYVVDGNGTLQRKIEHGRRELLDHSITI